MTTIYRLKYIIPALAFFAIGVSWGHWSTSRKRIEFARTTPLRVLCHENWIDQGLLDSFAREHATPVQLWTYSNPNEFLRQMANADGKVDVLCTSSLLVRSLIQSHWLRKSSFLSLENARFISVDFLHLPYDKNSEYTVPLFWNLYGFFGKGTEPSKTWKQTFQNHKFSIWGDELNVLQLMSRMGVKIEEHLQDDEKRNLETDIQKFVNSAASIMKPKIAAVAAESMMAKVDWVALPLSQVARLVGENSPYKFWLPSDGGAIETGLLAIGERAQNPELARKLVNALIATESALNIHQRVGAGVVHESLNHLGSIAPLQKSTALRKFPLNRVQFPDVSLEALPPFQKIYEESVKESAKN